jgi:glycosyltransferase involved in cell wall biosynthesis
LQIPSFSVIVPVHNRAHLIAGCVDSVLAQSFTDFELILVDNNSTDDLSGTLDRYDDSRIKLISCTTPGPSAARMAGVVASFGKYLSFIDSDDLWREDVLASVHAELESDKQPLAVYITPVRFRSGSPVSWDVATGKTDRYMADFLEAIIEGAAGACALAGVRRKLFENGAGFDDALWVGEDLDWALRKASLGPVCMLQEKARLGYRRHDDNITKDSIRYETWVNELLGFARSGRYETSENGRLRVLIVKHLVGQLQTILRMRNYRSFVRLYPRVLALGIHWRIFRPLLMPTLFAAYFQKRTKPKTS